MNYKNLTKEALPKEFQERIERFNRLFSEAGDGTFEENELFGYEMACIKQALSFAEYFKEMSLEECEEFYRKFPSLFELIEEIKKISFPTMTKDIVEILFGDQRLSR
jgi:hypothetical protein